MSVSDLSLFRALKARMSWLQKRQDVLAENVANADTPRFVARDLKPLDLSAYVENGTRLQPIRTSAKHMNLSMSGTGRIAEARAVETSSFETTPSGNSVSLEGEMMKVAQTQMDYQLATGLYGRGVGLIKTALGRA